jgi:AcrR family transcriptional regulator
MEIAYCVICSVVNRADPRHRVTDLCRLYRKIIAEASLLDRRIDILEAAARPFVSQGFAATSLDRARDEIGSAGGAIYCYYRSKPDLFLAVHRRAMELTQRAIRPPRESEGKVLERLRGTALAHTVLLMEQLPYLRVGGPKSSRCICSSTPMRANASNQRKSACCVRETKPSTFVSLRKALHSANRVQ